MAEITTKVEKKATPRKKGKAKVKVKTGAIHIQSTYNNTIITATDEQGNVLAWSSSGRVGFAGARKATPYAAQQIVTHLMEQLKPIGLSEVRIFVRGIGGAREAAVRALSAAGMTIIAIRDITPIPHNGVRAPKRRRV
ncbi:MAG: 30S ribosomal protein S11 [Candidatus Andersenbacteria bacterium]|nr:30S ribosomal protein S11 [Candidatus Andersenbacteria bacterium]